MFESIKKLKDLLTRKKVKGQEELEELLAELEDIQEKASVKLPPWTLRLQVPSGKIIFANDIRDLYANDREFSFDVMTDEGCRDYSKAYEELGLILCFCGNTCPGVYRQEDGSLAVGTGGYNEYTDEETPHLGKRVGSITTDLWWWAAADYEDYSRRDIALGVDTVIVEPGEYEITQYAHTLTECYEEPQTFATIRKVE